MLTSFGLSNYENKVYTKLLELGSTDARQISKASNVPYGRIYDVLNNLEGRGVIYKNNARPQRFTTVDPKIAIERLLQAKQEEIEELTKNAEIAKAELSRIYENKPRDKLIWKVAIGDELHSSYFELLKEANREFLGYVGLNDSVFDEKHKFLEYLSGFQPILNHYKQSKVAVRMLLGLSRPKLLEDLIEKTPEVIQMMDFGDIRITTALTNPFTVIDGQKVILKVDNPSNTNEFLAAIYLWQDSLAKTLKSKFEELWNQAKPIQVRLEV